MTHEMAWAGIDVGKTRHCACVVDNTGAKLWSAKLANQESDIAAMIRQITGLADRIVWAVDIIGAPSALLLALLVRSPKSVRYASAGSWPR